MIKDKTIAQTLYSYEPMPDGKIITINVKILTTATMELALGFASPKSRGIATWVGYAPESIGWYFRRDIGRSMSTNLIQYGRPILVGDVITVRLDLTTSAGSLTYLVNGQSQGFAYTGVKQFSPLHFGLFIYYANDAMEILSATIDS